MAKYMKLDVSSVNEYSKAQKSKIENRFLNLQSRVSLAESEANYWRKKAEESLIMLEMSRAGDTGRPSARKM